MHNRAFIWEARFPMDGVQLWRFYSSFLRETLVRQKDMDLASETFIALILHPAKDNRMKWMVLAEL